MNFVDKALALFRDLSVADSDSTVFESRVDEQ